MLYVTTRASDEIYTASHALRERRAPDGGLYIPFRVPAYSREEILALADMPFSQRVAQVLNRLFRGRLTSWDIDFCIGRFPVRLNPMSHRIVIAECFHNPGWTMDWVVSRLTGLILGSREPEEPMGEWPETAVGAGLLFGILGELMKNGEASPDAPVDVAVPSGELSAAMAAIYARQWGLPIANVVICCNENASLWELLGRGELKTGLVAVQTATPLCDRVIPRSLERLICAAGGQGEVHRFLAAREQGRSYIPGEAMRATLCRGVCVSVVSEKRMLSAIPNLCRVGGYIAGPYTALCHSGVQDYRARTGESRPAVVLAQRAPGRDLETVAMAMGISPAELENRLKNGER